MIAQRISCNTGMLFGALVICSFATAQTLSPMPPDYSGVKVHVPGVYIPPVPNAPFSADVKIVTHQKLADGTETVRMTVNHIARDNAGRIYNESRKLVTTDFKGDPLLTSAHIYDPATRLNIFYDPHIRLARETVLQPEEAARTLPTHSPLPASVKSSRSGSSVKETDLGDQTLDGTTLHGTQKQRTIDASASSTGQPIVITDEYWYAPDLFVYLIVKHDDPRSGEQIVAVIHIDRHEPPVTKFYVPADYKVVDETPPPR